MRRAPVRRRQALVAGVLGGSLLGAPVAVAASNPSPPPAAPVAASGFVFSGQGCGIAAGLPIPAALTGAAAGLGAAEILAGASAGTLLTTGSGSVTTGLGAASSGLLSFPSGGYLRADGTAHTLAPGSTLRVALVDGSLALTRQTPGQPAATVTASPGTPVVLGTATGAVVDWQGTAYDGQLALVPQRADVALAGEPGQGFMVYDRLDVEAWLAGVQLPATVLAAPAALDAILIALRTDALAGGASAAKVVLRHAPRDPVLLTAVAATKGQVLALDGKPAALPVCRVAGDWHAAVTSGGVAHGLRYAGAVSKVAVGPQAGHPEARMVTLTGTSGVRRSPAIAAARLLVLPGPPSSVAVQAAAATASPVAAPGATALEAALPPLALLPLSTPAASLAPEPELAPEPPSSGVSATGAPQVSTVPSGTAAPRGVAAADAPPNVLDAVVAASAELPDRAAAPGLGGPALAPGIVDAGTVALALGLLTLLAAPGGRRSAQRPVSRPTS